MIALFIVYQALSNIQKITCIILRNLFGLDLFSHQSCATGTLLLQKKIYPRKSSLNLKQLIFFMFLKYHGPLPRWQCADRLVVQKSVVLLVAGLELRILVTETIVDLLEVLCDR